MTHREKSLHARSIAAGTILGLAMGLIIALFVAMNPHFFARLVQ